MKLLSVDLGGTHADCAVIEGESILARISIPVRDCRLLEPILSDIAAATREMNISDIQGLGFGFCGLVDSRNCRVTSTNGKFVDAPNLGLERWAEREFHVPLRLENDARLALLGERYCGAARGEDNVVMFTLGTGVGGVAMIDGELLKGPHGQAGVLGGHVPVKLNGRLCTCGAIGCAEAEASGWALPLICAEWPGFNESLLSGLEINFEHLFAVAGTGDPIAKQIRDHCLNVWAAAAVAAIHAFDPELLVYGGGVMRSGATILPFIKEYVDRIAWTPWGKVQVRAAQLGNSAALLGVNLLFGQERQLVR